MLPAAVSGLRPKIWQSTSGFEASPKPFQQPETFTSSCRAFALPLAFSLTAWRSGAFSRHSRPSRVAANAEASGRRGRRGLEGIPLLSQLRDLWRRKLFVSAALALLMGLLWIYQGFQGWQNLKAFNMTLPWYKRLPASTALESWMLGTHPVALIGKIHITWSTLQGEFGMDATWVASRGQLHR
ncbi:RHBDF2, partial [Symbiodinium pilosum]